MDTTRRHFMATTGTVALLGPATFAAAAKPNGESRRRAALCVYGATLPGIAAAIAAARQGSSVVLVEPIGQVGGLVTSGLSWSDFRTFESLSGIFQEFARRVGRYYVRQYGPDSHQFFASFRGTHGEPHVNQHVLEQMLAEQDRIDVVLDHTLDAVQLTETSAGGRRIERARFTPAAADASLTVEARIFIDATYEGDLLARAGVAYRVGREGRDEYGESLAPAQADARVQGYNFRYVMTDVPDNRVLPGPPDGYDREDFTAALQHLGPGRIEHPIAGGHAGVFRTHLPLLPNRKADVNDTPHAPIRLSMPDINDAYPDGDAATRRRIFDRHVYYHQGLLHFLQNDHAVPHGVREQTRQWGFCRDEFTAYHHMPPLLYIREARRMIGPYVFTQHDTDAADDDIRSRLQDQAVAIGDYTLNCHGTGREGTRFDGRHVGEFYRNTRPFQLPYGMLVPRTHENLLVPVACSASHVGFSAIRLEPTWTALGHAAGLAAHLAAEEGIAVQAAPVPQLQKMLHADGAKTVYVSDVEGGEPGFTAVQYFGQRGAFHGLRNPAAEEPPEPVRIYGQYLYAYPWHAADLHKPMTSDSLAEKWVACATSDADAQAGLRSDPLLATDGSNTRGTFLMRLYERTKA